MKRSLLTLLTILTLATGVMAQVEVKSVIPTVDKRVELMSVVFRLAGRPEYNGDFYKNYVERINAHFDKYRDHELIGYVQTLIKERGISYDAVMSMAINLNDKIDALMPGTTSVSRWKREDIEKFIPLLHKFYKKTNFERFYKDNAPLYAEAIKRLSAVTDQLDESWYGSFFGTKATDKFSVILAPGNGGGNYGPALKHADGTRQVYAIMGLWSTDDKGDPMFSQDSYLPILVHEFAHSFVNNLTDKHKAALTPSGEAIFALVKEKMAAQAYGAWPTVMNEALVRASVVMYMKDHGAAQNQINKQVQYELGCGFLWIELLVKELENYSAQRQQYPTMDSYMPAIIKFYDEYASRMASAGRPSIVSVSEFENGATAVDPALTTITVNFDRALAGGGYSVFLGPKGKDAFPKVTGAAYADGNKSVRIDVALESSKEYQMLFKGDRFRSPEGIGIEDYLLEFKTK